MFDSVGQFSVRVVELDEFLHAINLVLSMEASFRVGCLSFPIAVFRVRMGMVHRKRLGLFATLEGRSKRFSCSVEFAANGVRRLISQLSNFFVAHLLIRDHE